MNLLVKILGSSILSLGIASPVFAELQSFECYDQKKARLATVWEQWQPMLTYNVETGSVYRYDFNNNIFNNQSFSTFFSTYT